ncbi:sensor histidine kinase [Streptomyces sp. NPDC057302]|uniref:sensor histidine kinase n=1 Tax=Streptomyces sp. NPDC057302 TaxID=3346094 RepID=UPI00363425EA
MPATPRLPLLKRIPPGVWTAVTWCAVTVHPLVEYVLMPPGPGASYSYPRHGMDAYGPRLLLLLGAALALAGCVVLSRRPLTAMALLVAGTGASMAAWHQTETVPAACLPVTVALGFIAARDSRRTSLIAGALPFGALSALWALRELVGFGRDDGTAAEPYVALIGVVAWLIGNSVHQARVYARNLRSQAAEQASVQAVTTERLRIARELHDMVAHSVGVIALQAGAARRVIDTQPDGAREALTAIEVTGRETLSGLRRMLGALRETEPGEGAAALDPEPGLASVDRLAETTTAAGVRVDVRWLGELRPLPPEIDVSAYRIIQEGLTNVVRHASTASCSVSVDCRAEELTIEVTDGGRGRGDTPATGYGLLGMRERVGLLHGRFSAGPRPEGGFRVAARLPLPAVVR